jgi:hypothetical protein
MKDRIPAAAYFQVLGEMRLYVDRQINDFFQEGAGDCRPMMGRISRELAETARHLEAMVVASHVVRQQELSREELDEIPF